MASKRVRLAQRRKAAGFTQESLADHLGVERSTVARWETAETEPQPWIRPKLAVALQLTLDELQALLGDVTIVQAYSSERTKYALEHPSSVDLVTVAHLHERVRRLDEQYDEAPSTALLGPAGELHGQVSLLRGEAAGPRARRALFAVEAESATFMAQLVWDVSQRRDHDAPIAYLDQAAAAARQVQDSSAEAYVFLRKSFIALYSAKNPGEGLALAVQAAEVASPASPSLTGLSLLHVAESYAMMRDARACRDALKTAEAQFDRVHADDVAAGFYTIDEYDRLAGSCFLYLDLPDRAEPILRSTARALSARKKSQAIALGNLALALIRQRKLDEAAATMQRMIDAVDATRGGGGLNLAFAAGRELQQWRHESWVQDINDRLLALVAAT